MKIVFLSTYSGPVNRGIESWVKEISNRLSQNNEVTVLQLGDSSGDEKYKVKKIYTNIDWNKKHNFLLRIFMLDYWSLVLFRFTKNSIKEIIDSKPDILIPLNGGWETILCKILSIYIGCKLVWVEHYLNIASLLVRPNLIISISPSQTNFFKRIFGKNILIPNGIDLSKFTKDGEIYDHKLKKPVVLFVGALVRFKNPDKTIKAVSRSKNLSLLMVGDGEEKYVELGKKLLGDRFLYTKVSFADMPKIYRSADIFTLASIKRREAFGNVYLEAMASGLPVVATDDKTRRYVINKAGLYIKKPKNIYQYLSLLNKSFEIDWKNTPVKQASKFNWNKIYKLYDETFKDLIKHG